MILNGATLDPKSLPTYDICIVGAGAVGIAMAHRLRKKDGTGLRVVVLESSVSNVPGSKSPGALHAYDPIPNLAALLLEPVVLFLERRHAFRRPFVIAHLGLGGFEPRLQRIALAAQLLDQGHRALHALVQPREDFRFFGAGQRHLVFLRFLHSIFTGRSSATRDARR